MTVLSKEFGDADIRNYSSIFELAVKIFFLSQYRKLDGFAIEKSLYCNNRNGFIDKFRLKYPQTVKFLIFLKPTCFMSLLKITPKKVNFCLMIEFQ